MDLTTHRTKTFEVELANEPGTLGRIAATLGKENINILGFAVTGHRDKAHLHLVANDAANAESLLHAAGYDVTARDALAVDLPNRPGALGYVASRLGEVGVNIEASFVVASPDGQTLQCAFALDDVDAAENAVAELSQAIA